MVLSEHSNAEWKPIEGGREPSQYRVMTTDGEEEDDSADLQDRPDHGRGGAIGRIEDGGGTETALDGDEFTEGCENLESQLEAETESDADQDFVSDESRESETVFVSE